jgi:hypothetical protein
MRQGLAQQRREATAPQRTEGEEVSDTTDEPITPRAAVPLATGERSTHVLDIAAHIMLAAERDGIEMTTAKLHFLCYQVQGWTLACTGKPAFEATIYAVADGVRIDEISTAYAPLGDGVFTLQDAIDAGVIAVPAATAGESAGNQEIIQQ